MLAVWRSAQWRLAQASACLSVPLQLFQWRANSHGNPALTTKFKIPGSEDEDAEDITVDEFDVVGGVVDYHDR